MGLFRSRDERYGDAISSVPGVAHCCARYTRHRGKGSTTRIEITTATNERDEMLQILEQSLKAFLLQTKKHEVTNFYFILYSQDHGQYLSPTDLGTLVRSLKDARKVVGL